MESPIVVVNEYDEHHKELEALGKSIQQVLNDFCKAKDEMQYKGLYQYCKSNLRYRGTIENFVDFLTKQKVQKKTANNYDGVEFSIYQVNDEHALTCLHYMKSEAGNLIEQHLISIK